MINLDRLQTWLNQGNLQSTNPPVYQLLSQLVLAVRELQTFTENNLNNNSGAIVALSDLDYLTHSDESIPLPNSRQLIAGTNVTFDDTVVGQRTVNVSASVLDHVVMSDGNQPPVPLDDGNGNFIYVPYTP